MVENCHLVLIQRLRCTAAPVSWTKLSSHWNFWWLQDMDESLSRQRTCGAWGFSFLTKNSTSWLCVHWLGPSTRTAQSVRIVWAQTVSKGHFLFPFPHKIHARLSSGKPRIALCRTDRKLCQPCLESVCWTEPGCFNPNFALETLTHIYLLNTGIYK